MPNWPISGSGCPGCGDARRDLIAASERITERVAADGGGVVGGRLVRRQQTLKDDLASLAERGILLRDPETGLVDFPTERDGERVILCWQLGEERVAYFHTERAGMSGSAAVTGRASRGRRAGSDRR